MPAIALILLAIILTTWLTKLAITKIYQIYKYEWCCQCCDSFVALNNCQAINAYLDYELYALNLERSLCQQCLEEMADQNLP